MIAKSEISVSWRPCSARLSVRLSLSGRYNFTTALASRYSGPSILELPALEAVATVLNDGLRRGGSQDRHLTAECGKVGERLSDFAQRGHEARDRATAVGDYYLAPLFDILEQNGQILTDVANTGLFHGGIVLLVAQFVKDGYTEAGS